MAMPALIPLATRAWGACPCGGSAFRSSAWPKSRAPDGQPRGAGPAREFGPAVVRHRGRDAVGRGRQPGPPDGRPLPAPGRICAGPTPSPAWGQHPTIAAARSPDEAGAGTCARLYPRQIQTS
jgi:hypothetical protein